jgi:putative acetyltransferase
MHTVIRKYKEDDMAHVLSAWERASQIAHPFLPREFLATERASIPGYLRLPATETWVVEQAHQVVGFMSLVGNVIGLLYVQPAVHGTGVGRALMDKAKELRRDLEVEVFAANTAACRFYVKSGFVLRCAMTHRQSGYEMLRLKFPGDFFAIRF